VKRDPKLRIAINGSLAYTGITFNVGNGPAANTILGQNKLVRQAFELSIDRDALVQVVFNNMNTPRRRPIRPVRRITWSLKPPARDVAKAKALLAEGRREDAGAGGADNHQ
jgi:peptide/nickel transport system substrate-binding protein